MAAGTVAAWTTRAAAGLAPFTAAARRALAEAELVHADESGLRVAGRLHWLHVASSSRFTSLCCHRKRGKEAIDAAGVLPHCTGTGVHDTFAPYARYPAATHALCNAHLFRELFAVVDSHTAHPPPSSGELPAGWCWATQVIDALLAVKAVTDIGPLPDPDALAAYRRLIVSAALIGAAVEGAPPGPVGRRHRALARPIRRRLDDYLRFAVDPRVPFDNNPAERDLRMVKIKAEIVRLPAHPRRRAGLRRDALLSIHRGQARPPPLRRSRRTHQRKRLDPGNRLNSHDGAAVVQEARLRRWAS